MRLNTRVTRIVRSDSCHGRPPRLWVSISVERLHHYVANDGESLQEFATGCIRAYFPKIDEQIRETVVQYDGYITPEF